MTAARWLEAAGYPDAAAELARAARRPLAGFWTDARLEALLRASVAAGRWAEVEGSRPEDDKWNLAVLCLNTAEFLAAKGLHLMAPRTLEPEAHQSAHVKRRVALLAEALLDLLEPGWRRKITMLRLVR